MVGHLIDEPEPRDIPGEWSAWLPTGAPVTELKQPDRHADKSFQTVLATRRSGVGGAIEWADVAELLWHACRTREWLGIGRAGMMAEHRALPSAGGLHAVGVLAHFLGRPDAPRLYLPGRHAFAHLPVPADSDVLEAELAIRACTGSTSGCALWLVGDYWKAAAAYKNPESLLWRDAGVIVAGVCLTAEMLDLASVPVGLTGARHVAAMGLPSDRFIALGAVQVGSRTSQIPTIDTAHGLI